MNERRIARIEQQILETLATAVQQELRDPRIGFVTITAVELVPYAHEHTFDILPDSDTGSYLADGVLIGSTLR